MKVKIKHSKGIHIVKLDDKLSEVQIRLNKWHAKLLEYEIERLQFESKKAF